MEATDILLKDFSVLILLDSPINLEFGIDFNCWTTDKKFKGLKFIPPGIHFIYYSLANSNFRTGFFCDLKAGQVLVKKWDGESESFLPETDLDQIERIKLSKSCFHAQVTLKKLMIDLASFDQYLGYYPQGPTPDTNNIDTKSKWINMTGHVSFRMILHALDKSDLQISAMNSVSKFSNVLDKERQDDLEKLNNLNDRYKNRKEANESEREAKSHWIEFTEMNLKSSYPKSCTSEEKTKYSIDKSYLLRTLLSRNVYKIDTDLLGEFQLSFLIFLLGQVYDGFEQWKTILSLLTHCDEEILSRPALFIGFIDCLVLQLKEFPSDFFNDELSSSPFLEDCFVSLFENCKDAIERSRGLPSRNGFENLKLKVLEFEGFIRERFDWEIGQEGRAGLDIYGEEAPVFVET